MEYTLHQRNGNRSLVLYGPPPVTLTQAHPFFDQIVELVQSGADDAQIEELLDAEAIIDRKVRAISPHAGVDHGYLTWDGAKMDTALSRHVVRLLHEGEDVTSIVRFMERLSANPSQLSRVRIWEWLKAHDFTLTDEGHIIGYRGVRADGMSNHTGSEQVWVDDDLYMGRIPNPVGSVVRMDREIVDANYRNPCSRGLHVGTFDHALRFGEVMLAVEVDPAHIVTVPQNEVMKMRVCQFTVLARINGPYITATAAPSSEHEYEASA